MKKIRTHYDNLKIARNAPPEVIRAAYKTLSQKYHPDRNPGSPEAARIMAIINAAYETLSDPHKRHEHDQWVAQQEMMAEQVESRRTGASASMVEPTQPSPASTGGIMAHIFRHPFFYGFLALAVLGWATDEPNLPPPGPKPYREAPVSVQTEPVPVQPQFIRPEKAPNGQPWPTRAGYVKGFPRLHVDGLSTLTVDNRQNDSDVFVKLVSLAGAEAYPVRQFYIPARGSFTLNKIRAGSYDIRYRDLTSGGLSRSDAFSLEEIATDRGTQFSSVTMTLYKVQDGNMQTYALAETEF